MIWWGVKVQISRPRPFLVVPSEVMAVPKLPAKMQPRMHQSSMPSIVWEIKSLYPRRRRRTVADTEPSTMDKML